MFAMNGSTILIVDDDRIFTKALGKTLANAGYITLECNDTTGALLHARNNSIDCAIIDYNLGAMLGTALMTRLRDDHPYRIRRCSHRHGSHEARRRRLS